MQNALDRLRGWLTRNFKERVEGKPFVCGSPDSTEDDPSFSESETMDALTRIRRFQILSADCEMMRQTVSKLASEPEEAMFGLTGKFAGKRLNCYNPENSKACKVLNCYRGPD